MTNTAGETVGRRFHQFQRDKFIAVKRATFHVLQPEASVRILYVTCKTADPQSNEKLARIFRHKQTTVVGMPLR
jgi:hypothetical protein